MCEGESTDSLVKAQENWRDRVKCMQSYAKSQIDEDTFEGVRETKLFHGLKMNSSTNLLVPYADICFCDLTQEFLVLDPSVMIHRYSVQAKLIQPPYVLNPTMGFTKMIWCSMANMFACYIPHENILWFLSSNCILHLSLRNEFHIENLCYDSDTNEIIVVGIDKVTRYSLHSREQILNSYNTVTYGDKEYGPKWKIENSSLIPQSSSWLRLAVSYLTTIYVLPLEKDLDKEEGNQVSFLARRTGSSAAAITILFFHPIALWIITGDQLGNVMGWNLSLECMMSCSEGHEAPVRKIVQHPSICGFLTSSDDNVLQVWSCNLRNKVEQFTDIGKVWGMASNFSVATIITLGDKLCCFTMQLLYVFFGPLTAAATFLFSTTNPMFSTKVIVASQDNSIRIFSSAARKQLNVQVLPPKFSIEDVEYSGMTRGLYSIIFKTGEVLVSNCGTCPVEYNDIWIYTGPPITCIVAYEHYEEVRDFDKRPQNPRVIRPILVRIIAGTEDGNLVVIDEKSGYHESYSPAHMGRVEMLWASTLSQRVISVGTDRCIKIWKIFPDIPLPLAFDSSINFTTPISHIASMSLTVCVVSNSLKTKRYQVMMYNMSDVGSRLEHHDSKDHTDLIVDISTSDALELCATSSMDNTIRLWDNQNDLLKVLEINLCALKLTFSSSQGNIVFAAGKYLYQIPYQNYLSSKYRARIITSNIIEDKVEDEEPTEECDIENLTEQLGISLHPVSSVPLESLDFTSSKVPRLDLMIQKHYCSLLEDRDEDIMHIKDGISKGSKLVADKSLMIHSAWEKYLDELLGRTMKLEDTPIHNIWPVKESYSRIRKYYNKPGVFKMFHGYSIEDLPEYPKYLTDVVEDPKLPLFGFLPNSLIYKTFDSSDVESATSYIQDKEAKLHVKYRYPIEILKQLMNDKKSQTETIKVRLTLSQLALATATAKKDEEETNIVSKDSHENSTPTMSQDA